MTWYCLKAMFQACGNMTPETQGTSKLFSGALRPPEHLLAFRLEVSSSLCFPQLVGQQLVHLLGVTVGDGLRCDAATCAEHGTLTFSKSSSLLCSPENCWG